MRDHLFEQQSEAMLKHVEDRAVAILTADEQGRYGGHGSGTCIRIGERFLIATAAHVVADVPLERLGVLMWRGWGQIVPRVLGRGVRGGGDDDLLDIAWLEIPAPFAAMAPRLWVPLDRLDLLPQAPRTYAFAYGAPEEQSREVSLQGRPAFAFNPMGFASKTISRTTGAKVPADWDYDVFLDYPDAPRHEVPDHWLKRVPRAGGMSGCGIWTVRPTSAAVWSPEYAGLAAVQHSWHSEERWLRGTLIRHWLEMVREDIPALAPEIDAHLRGERVGTKGAK